MGSHDEIMALEHRFWRAMQDGDVDDAISLLDTQSMSANAHGIHHFDPQTYRSMALSGDARITRFEFHDARVLFPTPDVAIASYRAKQAFTVDGHEQEMVVFDTTTWVRKDGRWLAAAHTETPAAEAGADAG